MANLKQVIIVRKDLNLGMGKTGSQVAHASLEALEKARHEKPEWASEWREQGQKKVVLKIHGKMELLELFQKLKKILPTALIKDAGRTQVTPGEATCIGIGPAPESEIDKYTKDLKLL